METTEYNVEKIVEYWIDSSNKDFKTMVNLYNSKDYHWSLFIGHLVIEKLLKAIYVKKYEKHSIFLHDLLRLAQKADIELKEEMEDDLDMITTFNINARYDNYKQEFYNRCTKEFTDLWKQKIENLRQTLITLL